MGWQGLSTDLAQADVAILQGVAPRLAIWLPRTRPKVAASGRRDSTEPARRSRARCTGLAAALGAVSATCVGI